jgi:UDP-N-acetylglucosamine 2-epimerase (non-hydrolysing)
MKIASVVGARPNFIKLAPIHNILAPFSDHIIIHTGQHYDYNLSKVFFKEFHLPEPTFDLNVRSSSPCRQIAQMLERLEKIFLKHTDIDLVMVYGDTNSTFAGALSAMKAGLKVAHIESGLRSFDRSMPEEINRVLTDDLSDYLFAPTPTAIKNLEMEHVFGKVVYTGDISVEILRYALPVAEKSSILKVLDLEPKSYILFTMHRAENTNSKHNLNIILQVFELISEEKKDLKKITIVFPIHPRTVSSFKENNLYDRVKQCANLKIIEPVGYIDFLHLMTNSMKIVTDSGGIQKESYLVGVPCVTIRNSTEWVETVNEGCNVLTGVDVEKIIKGIFHWQPVGKRMQGLRGEVLHQSDIPKNPVFGDGRTSEIIRDVLCNQS